MFEVYCLTSPNGRRYVGFTSQGSDRRWRKHVTDAQRGSKLPLHNAIRKYGPESFSRSLLERMTTEAGAKQAERLWIKELGTFGSAGYNLTLGGEGMLGHVPSAETRARVGAARRNLSDELRAKFAETQRGKIPSLAARARMSEAQRGRKHSPETIAKMSETAKHRSPETLANLSEAAKRRSPETRARVGAANRGRKHSPEARAKMSEAARNRSAETIARMSAAAKLREANKKLKREGN